jgi:hypothetical protein
MFRRATEKDSITGESRDSQEGYYEERNKNGQCSLEWVRSAVFHANDGTSLGMGVDSIPISCEILPGIEFKPMP